MLNAIISGEPKCSHELKWVPFLGQYAAMQALEGTPDDCRE